MKFLLTATALACSISSFAQTPATESPVHAGYTKLNGFEYKIVKDVPGKTAQMGEVVEFNLIAKADTTVLGDSYKKGSPIVARVEEAAMPGDFKALLPLLSAGDSVVVEISCDTFINSVPADKKAELPKWMAPGKYVNMTLSVVAVKTIEEYTKEAETKQAQKEKEEQEQAAKQLPIDDKILRDHFTKNKITAQKTSSGLYYTIERAGDGALIQNGQSVSMKYTGRTLDGKPFDSNIDGVISPNPHGTDPLVFEVGGMQIIAGIDEGVKLLKSGGKATFYIPSPLAYGTQSPTPDIPANSILIFEVEVTAMAGEGAPQPANPDQALADDKILKGYFAKKNIKAKKTASGLYYTIQRAGTGAPIKKGQSVSVKYTGRTMNGHVFDSNKDAAVAAKNQHDTEPLTFAVGNGEMIQGVDEGVALMKKGGKATFYVPSHLAYGTESPSPDIAPNSVLIFEVEVSEVK